MKNSFVSIAPYLRNSLRLNTLGMGSSTQVWISQKTDEMKMKGSV